MDRRRALRTVGSAGVALAAGCSAIFEDAGPFHFGITNWRERTYRAELLLEKNGETVVDGRFDIAANGPAHEEPPGIYLQDVARVTNGDDINARVVLDGDTYRGHYEVTCNRRDGSRNNFFLYIRSGEPGEITFSGSECGV